MKKHLPFALILAAGLCSVARAQSQAQAQHPNSTQQAQTAKHWPQQLQHWSFDLMAGPAFPVGQFANTEQQNPVSGPVHTGSLIEGSATYRLTRHFGVTILGASQYHNSDLPTRYIPLSDPAHPPAEYQGLFGPQYRKMTRLLAGGVYTIPVNSHQTLAMLVRALAGIQKTQTANYTYVLPASPNELNVFDFLPGQRLPWTFSYQADAGFQWKPARHWALVVYTGYNGSRPSYDLNIGKLFAPSTGGGNSDIKKLNFPTGSVLLRGGVQFSL